MKGIEVTALKSVTSTSLTSMSLAHITRLTGDYFVYPFKASEFKWSRCRYSQKSYRHLSVPIVVEGPSYDAGIVNAGGRGLHTSWWVKRGNHPIWSSDKTMLSVVCVDVGSSDGAVRTDADPVRRG
jgi:hypothetical protein